VRAVALGQGFLRRKVCGLLAAVQDADEAIADLAECDVVAQAAGGLLASENRLLRIYRARAISL